MNIVDQRWKTLVSLACKEKSLDLPLSDEVGIQAGAILQRWRAAPEESWIEMLVWMAGRLAAAMALVLLATAAATLIIIGQESALSPPPVEEFASLEPWAP